MVLAGHGHLAAARLEGLTHAPIIRFGHLTEVQKRAYVVADNKLAEQAERAIDIDRRSPVNSSRSRCARRASSSASFWDRNHRADP